jgi:hypothetical protein
MNMSAEIGELAKALAVAQAEMDFARKDSANPFFKSSYADLASVWDVCRRVLPKNGLAISQTMEPGDGVNVRTTLMHTSGQWISGVITLPPVKNDPQAYGSAVTYGRRYSLAAIVGVIADDDDAEGAMGRTTPNKASSAPKKSTPAEKVKDKFPGTVETKDEAIAMLKEARSLLELGSVWQANAKKWRELLGFDEIEATKDELKAKFQEAA